MTMMRVINGDLRVDIDTAKDTKEARLTLQLIINGDVVYETSMDLDYDKAVESAESELHEYINSVVAKIINSIPDNYAVYVERIDDDDPRQYEN